MSIAIPVADGLPGIVPDMGVYMNEVRPDNLAEHFARLPEAFFKLLGFAATAQVLGGQLAGDPLGGLGVVPQVGAAGLGRSGGPLLD